MMTKNKTLALIAAAVALGSMATPAFASASDKKPTPTRKVKVKYTKVVDQTKAVFAPQLCDANGRCSVLVATPGAVSGSLTGTDVSTLTAFIAGTDLQSSTLTSFIGTIQGCGTGAFVSRASSDFVVGAQPPVDWEVIPGTGTGDFVGITGKGTSVGSPDQLTYVSEGTIRCVRR